MTGAVQIVAFDVNQTLSDMEPLRDRLTAGGAPGHLLETWFAATLRDGFALAAAGSYAPFREVGTEALRALLSNRPGLAAAPGELAEQVLAGFTELDVHPDVVGGLRLLRDAGLRLVTLTNGSTTVSQALLQRAGVTELFERQLSVEDAGRWKPHPDAYAYAAAQCGVDPGDVCLVAVHPWDVDGAARAGMRTGWLNRNGSPYPRVFTSPDVTGADLPSLAQRLTAL